MENLGQNFQGIIIGLSTFLIIGIFHPLVIKGEYYFGKKVNIAFFTVGILSLIGALFCESLFAAALLSIISFSCFWSILEVFHQVRRVEKGWFPMNPKRKEEYQKNNFNKINEKKEGLHVSQRSNLINQHINN